jgi:hypothetical protein
MQAYAFSNLSAQAKATAIAKYWRDALNEAMTLNVTRQAHADISMDTFAWYALCSNSWIYNEFGERLAY